MRAYELTITDTAGDNPTGLVFKQNPNGLGFSKAAGGATFTSLNADGSNNPNALAIEFDFAVTPFNSPQGDCHIRVWGIGLGMISQAANLNGATITLSAGMKAGFPLVNPLQYGPILTGTIFQCYGNWQNTNQTLEFIVIPGGAQDDADINFVWTAGQTLASALDQAFREAFPKFNPPQIAISPSLILAGDEPGWYGKLTQFSQFIGDLSQKVGAPTYGSSYPGVLISVAGNTISAIDGTQPQQPKPLAFNDFIGQPTWMGPGTVNWKMVMRADLTMGQAIKFPPGVQNPYALTSQAAAVPNAPASSKTAFQGSFFITEAHHFGSSRQADADSWVTAYSAVTSFT